MKIHSIQQHNGQQSIGAGLPRLLAVYGAAIVGAAILGAATCTSVSAESGFLRPSAQPTHPSLGGQISHNSESYRVVNSSAIRTAADIGNKRASSPSIQQVGFLQECQSCGTGCGGTCGGFSSCGSCGTSCGGSCGGYAPFANFGNPCAPCEPFYYVMAEVLYMERDGEERYSRSPNYIMGGFEAELGGRLTIGSVPDCVHGYEASFTGFFEWDMAGGLADNTGNIQTFFTAGAPLVSTDLSAFNDTVTVSAQTYEAEYWSAELNKTLVSWDVAKLLFGTRYLEYDEEYLYFSQNATEAGAFRSATENHMIGLQVGMDLMYPVCKHGYADLRTRLGGFLNFAESDVRLINDGVTKINNFADDDDIAGVFELGAGLRYQLGQMLTVRGGIEVWYLTGLATANDQFISVLSPATTGRKIRDNDDVLITGLSAGAEFKF